MSIDIEIELFGIGTLKGELSRVYAPLSTDAIVNKLPIVLRGRFSFGSKAYWTLPGIEIYKGHNPKSVKNVEKGEIIYNPKTEELLIILQDGEMPNKVNKIGRVTDNLQLLLNAKNGLNTKINRMK
ncbi:MAG: hypothetical protein EAX91_07400 [Candidatus Lokiarchaeota archaeon]|nr:hypothetical protein [Candidatus Lokiarchaeota archaeon]